MDDERLDHQLKMKIFAKPDTQDWPLDPVYPRGLMYFRDDDGGELSLGHVWLDEWLRTLISGYEQLKWQECDSLTGQIDSKRESIVWSRQAGDVYLSISNHKLTIRDLDAFKSELARAVLELTNQYRDHPNWLKWCSQFRAVRQWAERI